MALVSSYEPKLQEIIADVISAHVLELVESGAIIDVLSSFGRLGSLVIMALIRNGQVKQRNQSDIFATFAQKLNSRRYCRQCPAVFNVILENYGRLVVMHCITLGTNLLLIGVGAYYIKYTFLHYINFPGSDKAETNVCCYLIVQAPSYDN